MPSKTKRRKQRNLELEAKRSGALEISKTLDLVIESYKPTFNWHAEGDFWIPNLITYDEIHDRDRMNFINNVARGISDREVDEKAYKNAEQFTQDLKEGIRRWHTYSPRKER